MEHNLTLRFVFPYYNYDEMDLGENSIEEGEIPVAELTDESPNATREFTLAILNENAIAINGNIIRLKSRWELDENLLDGVLEVRPKADAHFLVKVQEALISVFGERELDMIYEDPLSVVSFEELLLLLRNRNSYLRDGDQFTIFHKVILSRTDGTLKEISLPSTGSDFCEWNAQAAFSNLIL